MSRDWDYSQLSHAASEAGGPQKFIDQVADINYQRGVQGEKDTEGWKGSLLVVAAIGLWEGGKALYQRHKARKAKKQKALLEASNAAKQRFVESLEDESHNANTD